MKVPTIGKTISGIYRDGFVEQGKNKIRVIGSFTAKNGDYVILKVVKTIKARHVEVEDL